MNPVTSSITKSVGGNMIRNAVDNARSNFPGQQAYPNIKWENFNYPPLLKIIHYDPSELEEPHKSLVRKLNFTFIIMIIVCIINFINSIAQTAAGHNGLRILYSVLNILIFVPFALFAFYKGYRGLVYNKRELRFYYILHPLLAIACLIFSIISGGNWNGWTRVGFLFDAGDVFQGILAIIESILYTLDFLLICYCVWRVRGFSHNTPHEDRL